MISLRRSFLSLLSVGLAFQLCSSPATAQNVNYHLLKKVSLGGEGGWDYLSVDATHRNLFIAHSDEVLVYSLDHDSVVAHIHNTEGVHGVAIGEREERGFISCGRSNSVLMFNTVTLDTLRRIPVGERPDAIIYDYGTQHVFVMNAKSEDITVLDAKTGDKIGTIKLPGRPEFASSDQRGHVYVNLEDRSEIAKINSERDSIEMVRLTDPGKEPSGLAMDRGTDRLFIGCGNEKLVIMNAENGKVLRTFKIGKGVDAVAFDPFTNLIFSSCGDGTVTIVREASPNNFEFVQTLETQRGARTIALDPTTHDIYLVTAEFGETPKATAEKPHPRPEIIPGSFVLLKYGEGKK